jgi:hypothetical protein
LRLRGHSFLGLLAQSPAAVIGAAPWLVRVREVFELPNGRQAGAGKRPLVPQGEAEQINDPRHGTLRVGRDAAAALAAAHGKLEGQARLAVPAVQRLLKAHAPVVLVPFEIWIIVQKRGV